MQSSITFEKACCEISQSILAREKLTVKTARDEIMRICAKYSLSQIPRNDEILATVNGENYKSLQKILIRKPVKTAHSMILQTRIYDFTLLWHEQKCTTHYDDLYL